MALSPLKVSVIGTRGFPDYIGGIETVCKNLYYELVKLDPRCEVVVLTRHSSEIVNTKHLIEQITVKQIPTIKLPGIENALGTFLSVLYSLLIIRPDIIHLHGIGPGFFTRLAKLTGKKVVVTTHASDYERPKWGKFAKWFLKTGEAQGVKYAHKMICVSQALKEELQARYPKYTLNIITIRNGGSLPDYQPIASFDSQTYPAKSYFLYVGRLEATKAIDELMMAFVQAKTAKKLVIVGKVIDDNEYWSYLQTLASPNIIFVGDKYGSELFSFYKNAAALVHPARMEGYCLAVAESISVKTPVILSDIPPHREFKLPQASYFTPGNIPQLAAKLSASSMQDYISEEAISYQRANTWQVNASLHLEVYRELCKLNKI